MAKKGKNIKQNHGGFAVSLMSLMVLTSLQILKFAKIYSSRRRFINFTEAHYITNIVDEVLQFLYIPVYASLFVK